MTEKVSFWIATFVFALFSIVRTAQRCFRNLTNDSSSSSSNVFDDDEYMIAMTMDPPRRQQQDHNMTPSNRVYCPPSAGRRLVSLKPATTPSNGNCQSSAHQIIGIRRSSIRHDSTASVLQNVSILSTTTTPTNTPRSIQHQQQQVFTFQRVGKEHFWRGVVDYSITFNSSFLIVGGLSESYLYGVRMLGNILAVALGHVYALLLIYPFMYSLSAECRTPYEYLRLRYRRTSAKLVCLVVGVFYYFSFLSLYLWGSSAILNLLMPEIDLQTANLALGLFSMLGTLLGGLSQSCAANLGQFVCAFVGILVGMALTLKTTSGGHNTVEKMWTFAQQHNRTTVFDPNLDVTTRYTILNQLVSLPLPWCSKLGLFLPNYMRYRSIRPRASSRALFLSTLPLTVVVNTILILAGSLFCFVHFYGCDPLKAAMVANKNQIGIYWLHSILADNLPNISGVVFACILYHAVVQHSSGISLIARTLNEEVFMKMSSSETINKVLERAVPILVGAASIPYSALFQYSRNTMLSLFYMFNNSLNSPILGYFLLSMFNPLANHVGALAAFLLNVAINCWLVLGNLVFSRTRTQEFDHHTESCANSTAFQTAQNKASQGSGELSLGNQHAGLGASPMTNNDYYYPKNELLYFMYSIAPIWYCLFSVLFCALVGTLLSLAYSLVKTGRCDLDYEWRHERRKYLFFYRVRQGSPTRL